MWKYVFLFVVVAVVVVLPASAVTPAPSSSQPAKAAASSATPLSGSVCTALKDDCGVGCISIKCDGTQTCTVGANYVECDGVRTYCPMKCTACQASILCGSGPGGGQVDCDGLYYCTSAEGCWVTCDGQTTYCPDAPAPPECPYPQ